MNEKTVSVLLIVILIIVILMLIAYIYKLVMDKIFQNSISQSKLALRSGIEKTEENDKCYVYISNRSFSNVVITTIGFKDSVKEYNYTKKYCEDFNIQGENILIPARQSIKLFVDFDELYKIFEGFKIDNIYCYTIDILGFKRVRKCKLIKKEIVNISKPIYKEKKKALKLEEKNNKEIVEEINE